MIAGSPEHFPVEPVYRIRADVAPLVGTHTVRDADAKAYEARKRKLVEETPQRCRAIAADAETAGLSRALGRLASIVAGEQPAVASELVDVRRMLGAGASSGSNRAELLSAADQIAFRIQEDFVVMRAGLGAELLHVCFPSHWDPGAHAGSPLAALHGPVPHGGRLQAASENLLKAMIAKGPFERWVWSVSASGELSQHPDTPRPVPGPGPVVDQLWFRVERQTTIPMPDLERSVFTIRVFQTPLSRVLAAGSGRAARLAEAIRSMDEPLRRYKGLEAIGERLSAELERARSSERSQK